MEEKIKKAKNRMAAYEAAIKRMQGEKDALLNGRPLKTKREDGLFDFHPQYKEIQALDYDIVQVEYRLGQLKKEYRDVL